MEYIKTRIVLLRIALFLVLGFLAVAIIDEYSITTATVLIVAGAIMWFTAPWLAAAKSYRTTLWYGANKPRFYYKEKISTAYRTLDELEKRFAGALIDPYDTYNFDQARRTLAELEQLLQPGLTLNFSGEHFYVQQIETFIDLLEVELPLAGAELQNANITLPEDPQKRYQKLQKFFYVYLEQSSMDDPKTRTPRSEVLTKGYLKLNAYI